MSMILLGKPKIAEIIVGRLRPKFAQGIGEKSPMSPMEIPQADATMELEAAAEAVIQALQAGDAKGYIKAFFEFHDKAHELGSGEKEDNPGHM